MIDEEQHEIRELAGELGLTLTRILRGGFGYVRPDRRGPAEDRRAQRDGAAGSGCRRSWAASRAVPPGRAAMGLADRRRPRAAIGGGVARRGQGRRRSCARRRPGLRGFFLADPDELSLIALVDQFADDDAAGAGRDVSHRGRQRSARPPRSPRRSAIACISAPTSSPCRTAAGTCASASRTAARCRRSTATTRSSRCRRRCCGACRSRRRCPRSSTTRLSRLKYGRATKTLLQFSKRFWRAPGRPRAFGSPLPFGAVWDGNEEQRGRAGILSLLAGGGASDATQAIVAKHGARGLARRARLARVDRRRAARVTADRLGAGSVRARRLRVLRSGFDPSLRAVAGAAGRAAVLRRRAHQHQVAGLHERRGGKRPPRGGGDRRGAPIAERAVRPDRRRRLPAKSPRRLAPLPLDRVVVDARLDDLGEAASARLLVERLLQQPRFVDPVQPSRVGSSAAVGRKHIVLDTLRHADNAGVARVGCRALMHAIVGFFNNPVRPAQGLGGAVRPSA